MEPPKIVHFMYMPLLGLGLYGGHRGSRWLRNRIKIFKQFVIPSLQSQTSKNFILWISVRHQDRYDTEINGLKKYMESIHEFRTVFTHSGVCFYDDKYPDTEARDRLAQAVHGSLGELFNITEVPTDFTYLTIQPSDDCYHKEFVEQTQKLFSEMPSIQVLGFRKGYVMDYKTLKIAEWNPNTIPPFFTIKFPTPIFIEPYKHIEYTGPYKSHEDIGDKLKMGFMEMRGFIVGCHGENISTHFNHPFKGSKIPRSVLSEFGLSDVQMLKLKISFRKLLIRKLPHNWQRKLRYVFGERGYARLYNWIRA